MEIRGLGIINVQDLFGILATLHEKEVELVAEMIDWSQEDPTDRLGLEDDTHEILGVALPMVRIPIRPGRSIATIIEVAARNHVLKRLGHHTAREFAARLDDAIARRREKSRLVAGTSPGDDGGGDTTRGGSRDSPATALVTSAAARGTARS